MDKNTVSISGRLTRDPELRVASNNSDFKVCKFGIASNRKYKNKSGETVEKVCFVDCVAFGKTGELIADFFDKGRRILIDARREFDTYETKTGDNRSKHELAVDAFYFIDSKTRDQQGASQQSNTSPIDDADVPF